MGTAESQENWVARHKDGVLVAVYAAPGSSRSAVQGLHANALKVAVRAAPEKGKANKELLKVLAKWLNISVGQLSLVSGSASRRKKLYITGVTVELLESRLSKK